MARPTTRCHPSALTEKQGLVLAFLHEWAGERGLTIRELPGDYAMGEVIGNAFTFHRNSGVQYMVQLRAAGCFGNPADARLSLINDMRVQVLRECLLFLRGVNGDPTATELRSKIVGVL